MGFDVSYHPVDIDLIRERIIPYILGAETHLIDLMERMVRVAKVRFRANAWGLGAIDQKWPGFESRLHVWGRPFFITKNGDEEIGRAIDRYVDCEPDQVDPIAREMLTYLSPKLAERVVPDSTGRLPDDLALSEPIIRPMWSLRDIVCKLTSGEAVMESTNELDDPMGVLVREAAFEIVKFTARLRPGWMDRGRVWPSVRLDECMLPGRELFEPPTAILGDLLQFSPQMSSECHSTIVDNYSLGGYVAARNVPKLRAIVAKHEATLAQGGELELSVRKLLEALGDAEQRGLPFVEATEIYSGMSGVIN